MKLDEFYKELEPEFKQVKVGDLEFSVRQYLPLRQKFQLVMNIVNGSYSDDEYKGLLSYLSYNINMIDFYSDIDFNTEQSYFDVMDFLDEENITEKILSAIPETEKDFIQRVLLEDSEERKKKEDSLIGNLGNLFKNLSEEINSLDDSVLDRAKEILSATQNE